MELTERQQKIVLIVRESEPISGHEIAEKLGFARATLRNDLSLLTMLGVLDAKPKVGYFIATQTRPNTTALYEMLYDCPVSTVMNPPRIISTNTTVSEAISLFFLYDTGSLIVLDDDKLLAGVVSRKDLLRVSMNGSQNASYPIATIMTRMPNIVTIHGDETLLDASLKMMECQIDSLPVVSRQNERELIGKISKTMITHYFTTIGLRIREEQS